MSIDLDLHSGDLGLFLAMLNTLLEWADSHNGRWHVEIAERDAGGIHLTLVFRRPLSLTACREQLRRKLGELERGAPLITRILRRYQRLYRKLCAQRRRYPQAADPPDFERCGRAASMKPLSKAEIFPNPKQPFRLPLGKGRIVLCDRPVADVISYVRWLDSSRPCMPVDEIRRFVTPRLTPRPWTPTGLPGQSSSWHLPLRLADDFQLTATERQVLIDRMRPVLHCHPEEAVAASKLFVRFVAAHDGEIAREWLPELLGRFDIAWGRTNKRSDFLKVLRKIGWIAVLEEAVYFRSRRDGKKLKPGKARKYGIGPALSGRL